MPLQTAITSNAGSWAWLGFRPRNLYTVDYFPVLPWFGWFLIGSSIGKIAYPGGSRAFSWPELGGWRIVRGLSFLGRNTLKIYLTHQPLIIILLILGGLVPLSYFLG